MIVYKLTQKQVRQLQDYILETGSLINLSVQDKHGNMIISEEVYGYVKIGKPIHYEPITLDVDSKEFKDLIENEFTEDEENE